MKKFLGGFLALILVLTLLPGVALADGAVAQIDGVEYDTLTEALGAAVLCLLGLCLPALRKNRG